MDKGTIIFNRAHSCFKNIPYINLFRKLRPDSFLFREYQFLVLLIGLDYLIQQETKVVSILRTIL